MSYDDLRYLAKYSHDNDLINKPGWKQLHRYFKKTKNINLLLKYANSKQLRNTVNTKFEMNIPCDHK